MLLAVGVGAALGIFSFLADGVLRWRLFEIVGNLASPWGLVAFMVGWLTTSPKRGAVTGGLTLLVGVATYYVVGTLRGYVFGAGNLVWMVAAVVVGPVMGLSGAAASSGRERPPVAAVAAPSILLLAEAFFLVIDRRVWLWNLQREPYRLVDLGVIVVFIATALAGPLLFMKDRSRLRVIYPTIFIAGLCGTVGFVWLRRLIVMIAQIG